MVVLPDYKQLNTNIMREIFDDSKMSFASEEKMIEKIGIRPGSVSPFALINNIEKDIKLVIDSELRDKIIGFHPLQNDNTVVLKISELEKFLKEMRSIYLFHAF
jgi:Ala-tRNA(Pro) deacylase